MKFENLRSLLIKENEHDKDRMLFYVEHGYCQNCDENCKNKNDEGIKRYSTITRWKQYQNNKISRDEAVKYAQKRVSNMHKKDLKKRLEKLTAVENAQDLEYINISIDWVNSNAWGRNPHAEALIDGSTFIGYASGWGYDKESSAIAQALNQSYGVLKVLYTLKENALQIKESHEAPSIGYGTGCGVLPHFEHGVGTDCLWSVFRKAGYQITQCHSKYSDFYRVHKIPKSFTREKTL